MPCPCCGVPGGPAGCNYSVEAEWEGMTMTLESPQGTGIVLTPDPGVASGGAGSDVYRLGIFNWEYYDRIVGCFLGSWLARCAPPSGIIPPAEECSFQCTCIDTDTESPCSESTSNAEYVLTGHIVTVYNPVAQNCEESQRFFTCGFRGQMSVWKYTYVRVGNEPSGQADVEELLYATQWDGFQYVGATSYIPCSLFTPDVPTVTIYFE